MKKRYIQPVTNCVAMDAEELMEAQAMNGSVTRHANDAQAETLGTHDSYFNYGGEYAGGVEEKTDAKGHSAWSSWDD